jgi:hypothetical protein
MNVIDHVVMKPVNVRPTARGSPNRSFAHSPLEVAFDG